MAIGLSIHRQHINNKVSKMGVKTVQLALTSAEKSLLLQVVAKDEVLRKVLRFNQVKGNQYIFFLTIDEAEAIGDLVLETLKKNRTDEAFRELKFLLQLIADAILENIETKPMSESNLPPKLQAAVQKLIEDNPSISIEKINAELARVNEKYNNTGQERFQGLSPNQLNKFVNFEMDAPDAAIQLNKNIPLEEFANAPFLNNSRILLHAAIEGMSVTALGNLNRKSTKMLMDAFTISDEEREFILNNNKTMNEEMVQPVHLSRIICELAELIKISKGAFRITKLGQSLLAEEKAGELFALLFFTNFRKFNLGYVDGCPELPGIQATIGYSLYVASKMEKWTKMESAAEMVFLPTVLDGVDVSGYVNEAVILAKTRLIVPLTSFGLMECEIDRVQPYYWRRITRVRKTKLFDRFLQFNVGASQKRTSPNRFSNPKLN